MSILLFWILETRIKSRTEDFWYIVYNCIGLLHFLSSPPSASPSYSDISLISLTAENGDLLHPFEQPSSSRRHLTSFFRRSNTAKKISTSPRSHPVHSLNSLPMDPPPKHTGWYCTNCGYGAHSHVTDPCCCLCGVKRAPDSNVDKRPVPRPPVQQDPPPKKTTVTT